MKIDVSNPMECPLNSECQCGLYSKVEGSTANECPEGEYPHYKFPSDCPLIKGTCIIRIMI